MTAPVHTVRLVLGDQLNLCHSWFNKRDKGTVYLLCECRSETDYVRLHIQKVVGCSAIFFDQHFTTLSANPRTAMMTQVWNNMKPTEKAALLEQVQTYLAKINDYEWYKYCLV